MFLSVREHRLVELARNVGWLCSHHPLVLISHDKLLTIFRLSHFLLVIGFGIYLWKSVLVFIVIRLRLDEIHLARVHHDLIDAAVVWDLRRHLIKQQQLLCFFDFSMMLT
jgi:hypothetical protein